MKYLESFLKIWDLIIIFIFVAIVIVTVYVLNVAADIWPDSRSVLLFVQSFVSFTLIGLLLFVFIFGIANKNLEIRSNAFSSLGMAFFVMMFFIGSKYFLSLFSGNIFFFIKQIQGVIVCVLAPLSMIFILIGYFCHLNYRDQNKSKDSDRTNL